LKPDPHAPVPKAPKGAPLEEGSLVLKLPALAPNAEGDEVELVNDPVLPFIKPPDGLNVDARNGFAAPPVI